MLRKLQEHFNPSKLFAPLIAAEQSRRTAEAHNQRQKRRRHGREPPKVKLGHGGTLDPLATGVLTVGIGSGTKSLQRFLLDCTKEYECVVLFGAATDTFDRLGKVVGRAPYVHVTKKKVEEALNKFRGNIMQKPPIFSALKVEGKKMYEYAREGKELPIEIQERPVEVMELEMVEWMEGGAHSYELPEAEADSEEKLVASKLLNISKGTDHFSEEKQDDIGEMGQSGTKRSHPDSVKDETEADTPSKRARLSQDSPMMSGALPPDESDQSHDSGGLLEDKTKEQKSDPLSENPQNHRHESESLSGPPAAMLRMTVTSGFYVRSLCHDLGAAVGSLGLMSELVRTRQGVFELGKNVLDYDVLEKGEEIWAPKVQDILEISSTLSEDTKDKTHEQRRRNSSSEIEDSS